MPNTPQLSIHNPWPGLRPFTEGDREFFFGRAREAAELLDLIQHSSALVLYGQSGLGKTSLLQAAILPELRRLDFLPIRVRFDHGVDAPALTQQIKNELTAELNNTNSSAPRPGQTETLWEYFHRRDVDFWGPRNRLLTPVIILDQFEEVFTLGQRSDESAARVARLAAELESVLENRAPDAVRKRLDANPDEALLYELDRRSVIFLISLREDFLPDLDPWRARIPSLLAKRFRLERMTGAQALEVVQGAGHELLGPDVAREIVDFVSKSSQEHISRSMEQRDVEPALLSVVCDELNRRRIERGKSQITGDLLTEEREGIIQTFYEHAFDGISPKVRDWVENKLLTASGYRNRAALDDALREGLPEADFDLLVDRRILHREERDGVVWIELTHDLLSDPASRSRASRDQRREADAAKEREARYARDLRRSRSLVGVFGVLLAGAAIALLFGIIRDRQAKQAEAHRGQTYLTAENMTERLVLGIDGSDWIPAAAVVHEISRLNTSFDELSRQSMSPAEQIRLKQDREFLLLREAHALYEIGHFQEGLDASHLVAKTLGEDVDPPATTVERRDWLAEARYDEGLGQVTAGQLVEAEHSLGEALNLTQAAEKSAADKGAWRVWVLSQIAMGQLNIQRLAYSQASAHFRAALNSVQTHPLEDGEALSWKALALQGLGTSEWDQVQAEKWYAQAENVLNGLIAKDGKNLRWKGLLADLNYRQGFSDLQLSQYDDARSFLDRSLATALSLCNFDCKDLVDAGSESNKPSAEIEKDENWRWGMLLLQAWRGLGEVGLYQQKWDSARTALESGRRVADMLDVPAGEYPSWARAAWLHGVVLWDLAKVQKAKFDQPGSPGESAAAQAAEAAAAWELSSSLFDQSYRILNGLSVSAPANLETAPMTAWALSDQGFLYVDKADRTRASAGANQQATRNAEKLDEHALALYDRVFAQLKPIEDLTRSSSEVLNIEAVLYLREGDVLASLDHKDRVVAAYRNAISFSSLLAKVQDTPDNFDTLARNYVKLADVFGAQGDLSNAAQQYVAADGAISKALNKQAANPTYLGEKGFIHSRIADVAFKRGDLPSSLDESEKALDSDWAALKYDYSDSFLNNNLTNSLTGMQGASLDNIKTALGKAGGTTSQQESVALLKRIEDLRKKYEPLQLLAHYGEANGAWRPLMPGAWRVLAGSERGNALGMLLAVTKDTKADQVRLIRTLPLDFYDNTALYEAGIAMADGETGVLAFVRYGAKSVLLDGTSGPIWNTLNKVATPKLDSPDRAIAYLRFFVGALQDRNQGQFTLIDQESDLDWLPSATADQRKSVSGEIRPLTLEASPDGDWQAIASMEAGGSIFDTVLHLSRLGAVTMSQNGAGTEGLPILINTFANGIRVSRTMEALLRDNIKADPSDEMAVQALPRVYTRDKLWKEAADAQNNWVAFLQRKVQSDPKRAKDLENAYFSLADWQLLAHEFAAALSSAEAQKKLNPSSIEPDELAAHALLFLGRDREAEEAYLKDAATDGWRSTIANDFTYMRGAGLTSPKFDRILGLLDLDRAQSALKSDPNSPAGLEALPGAYLELKRWPDAIDAQTKWIAFLQRTPPGDAKRDRLQGAYTSLAWFQLMARDFAGALASSETGLQAGESLPLETNRAHALLFLGRTQQAKDIYLKYRNQPIEPNSKETWNQTILNDFDDLQREGLTNPEIGSLRDALRQDVPKRN